MALAIVRSDTFIFVKVVVQVPVTPGAAPAQHKGGKQGGRRRIIATSAGYVRERL
jgi:hypothetical protein